MKLFIKKIAMILIVMMILPAGAFAASDYIAGKIQGASYVLNNTVQPKSPDDPRVAMESEFVLQTDDGHVYFLPNCPRSVKLQAVNKDVRVYGDKKNNETIFVKQIKIEREGKFVDLCDWNKKMEDRTKP